MLLFIGKGKVVTYWLLGATDQVPICKKHPEASKLQPLFRSPRNLGPGGGQATPAMSGTGPVQPGGNTPEVW